MATSVSYAPEADSRTPAPDAAPSGRALPVIIVGGGLTGVRAANRLAAAGRDVLLFNAEPYEPYNRVKLTPLLAGDVQIGEIALALETAAPGRIDRHDGLRVDRIDRINRRVITADGGAWPYDSLILATGSSAFVPAIEGRALPGVYSFRDAADAAALLARSFSARRVLVIGGGLLGLEAARGMQRRGATTTIVEHENRLMPRQLDTTGAALLRARIEGIGVRVHTGVAVQQILGADRVEGARLRSGERIACDTVIICAGIRANLDLARQADLSFNRGVLVDDRMRSADPDIYAIGECAEHRGRMAGLVGPGLEQADVAVDSILGTARRYAPMAPTTKLKVLGADVFSAGDIEQLETQAGVESLVWSDGDHYRRLFLDAGRLRGAIAVGPCDEASRLQDAVARGAGIGLFSRRRFERDGVIWPTETRKAPAALPAAAIVCNCTGVTCGQLRESIAGGARTVDALRMATGASTVCGTCAPQIEALIEAGAPPRPVRLYRAILWASGAASAAVLATLAAPRVPVPDTFGPSLAETLWFDGIVKQWSGYILLAITVAAMALGLRKRVRATRRLGGYDWWRIAHLGLGAGAAIGLFVHTGFRPGANLNLALFLCFALTLALGAVAGMTTGGDHALRARGIGSARTPPRLLPTWLHVLAVWPLPALLLVHVLTVYAF